MKTVTRYQSQLLIRKSYKPNRVVRISPAVNLNIVFRPRAGARIERHECKPFA
jgi:hypothetical protein